MQLTPFNQRLYGPQLAKTFPNALSTLLAREFPHLGGPKVRELFVGEVTRLVETYYRARDIVRPGQLLWFAVDQTDLPKAHYRMSDLRLVPVVLTLIAPEDIQALMQNTPRRQVLEQIVVRLHREAAEQGGVLAETDSALLIAHSGATVSQVLRQYEQRTQTVVARRGTVHDLGPSRTHKAVIVRKVLCEGKSTSQVAHETFHRPESVDRYLLDLMRCYVCLKRYQQSPEQTAFATHLRLSLVKEYQTLIDELNLNDDRLPAVLARLAETAPSARRTKRITRPRKKK